MNTATEIAMKHDAAVEILDAYLSVCGMSLKGMVNQLLGHEREVCGKRARKLKRRGETVYYSHRTPTGKARYKWLPFKWSMSL